MLQEGFITFFEIIKAILMGIVEGITEWLPISSTGHMILVEQVVKFNASEEALGKIHPHPAAAGNTNFHIITSFYGL